ncbi:conserved phage C-terminal domain-containing protein [Vibrio harveyi]
MSNVLDMLFVKRPLVVNPQLAAEIGLNEAIILQQVKYWADRSEFSKDGLVWIYKTAEDWEVEFPFWSKPTIRRTLKSIEKMELIKSAKLHGFFFKDTGNQTLWYAINTAKKPCDQIDNMEVNDCENGTTQHDQIEVTNLNKSKLSKRSNGSDQIEQFSSSDQHDQFSTETTTETTPKTTSNNLELKILNYLNARRKSLYQGFNLVARDFRVVESNLKPIRSVLKAKYSKDDIKLVIDYLIIRWGNDASMREFLTPASIFRATKFETKLNWAQSWADNGQMTQPNKSANDLNWGDTSWADELNLEDFQ